MDKPTYNQINTLFGWAEWAMPKADAVKFANTAKTISRKEISQEIARILKIKNSRYGRATKEDLMGGIIGKKMLEDVEGEDNLIEAVKEAN